ncbi:hypothetical protein HJC23_005797 [Cyclotella cryptica]|uniref:Uncharacterized protein n=1 Tax=Cyclotella cryptica TaxID=29204 RepID=A0ABD3NL55_9STRA|eukprot:CCRYP_020546-RA/>CCRYP_020546-RA protein AED:0.14 eAED:0.14 QI:0/-1/0/1/-1/1/1/0/618
MRSAIGHFSDKPYSHAAFPQDNNTNIIDLTQEHVLTHSTQPRRERRFRKPTEFYKPQNDSCSPTSATERKRKTSPPVIANKSRSPRQKHKLSLDKKYVGSRVGKYFGRQLYLGTITSCDTYYHVLYDDDDEEDLDREELMVGLELYASIRRELSDCQTKEQKMKRTISSLHGRHHPITSLLKDLVRTPKTKGSKNHSTLMPSAQSITQKVHRPHQRLIGPTLFEQHNITATQMDAISRLFSTPHQTHAIPITEFFLFCFERQLIWKRKRCGILDGEHLTKDVKMARNFFCNIYRELDRGTTYFRGNLIRHRTRWDSSDCGAGYNLEEVLWDSLCYRLVNKIETFDRFGSIPHRGEWKAFVNETLQPLWTSEETVFTGAHQTVGKDRYLHTMNSLWENDGAFVKELAVQISTAADIKSCYSSVLRVKNVGKFLAWQVVCDLIEAKAIRFTEDEWVKLGPGAIKGLNVIYGGSLNKSPEPLEKAVFLREIQHKVYEALEISFPRFIGRDITLKNIEHSLCEFCKYKNDKVTRKFDLDGNGSRSHLDFSKGCRICDKLLERSLIKICDLCRSGYCRGCYDGSGQDTGDSWLCSDCVQIESQCIMAYGVGPHRDPVQSHKMR